MVDYKASKLEVIPEVVSGLGQHGTELSKMKQGVSFVTLISYTAVQVVQCSSVGLYPLPSYANSTVSLSCFLITC